MVIIWHTVVHHKMVMFVTFTLVGPPGVALRGSPGTLGPLDTHTMAQPGPALPNGPGSYLDRPNGAFKGEPQTGH